MSEHEVQGVKAVKQKTEYTCGPASLSAVMEWCGSKHDEEELRRICKTSERDGTSHVGMMHAAAELGFKEEVKEGASLRDLERKIDEGKPVIVDYRVNNTRFPDKLADLMETWLPKGLQEAILRKMPEKMIRFFTAKGRDDLMEGHYSVAVGYDDRHIVIDNTYTGKRTKYSKREFEKEWRYQPDGDRWMMVVSKE